jgi:hypothetical protein
MSGDRHAPRGTSRRAVLAGAVSGCVLATLPDLPTRNLASRNRLIACIRALLGPLGRMSRADQAIARAIVFGSAHPSSSIEQLTDAEIGTRIRNNIAADYRDGRLVDLQGWRIARTESQALALMRRPRHA